jgi:methyltransferase (TIGR00027 family)
MQKENTRRIETRPSSTAVIMCLARAASYKDNRECYSGPDNIAHMLIPTFFKLLFKSSWLLRLYMRFIYQKGMYEYVIARTKYINSIFSQALKQDFNQIVIFGAGFDSRALRFQKLNINTKIFEMDAPITQIVKRKAFRANKLIDPQNLTFVPIDFNKDNLAGKNKLAGFVAGKKSLFILEGITMYLSPESINNTFTYISEVSGVGSLIVFDYIYSGVLRGENKYYGENNAAKYMANLGEAWTFSLEENGLDNFLNKYGFKIQDDSHAKDLENRCFCNSKGIIVGKINGTLAISAGIKA